MFGQNCIVIAITNKTATFQKIHTGYVSVFSHSEKCEGVYLKRLKYELENAILTNTFPLGVSNEFIGKESSIAVKNGTLLIIFPQ